MGRTTERTEDTERHGEGQFLDGKNRISRIGRGLDDALPIH
jgi:hypothetical protein